MRIFKILFPFIVLMVLLCGCASKPYQEKIDDIVRIFFHENSRFSFFVEDESGEIKLVEASYGVFSQTEVILKADVPDNKKMWTIYEGSISCVGEKTFHKIEIHIHSAQDVDGGGWNHGKFGKGSTAVIE